MRTCLDKIEVLFLAALIGAAAFKGTVFVITVIGAMTFNQ